MPRLPRSRSRWRRWRWWIVGAVALILGLTVVAPFVFIHFIERAAPPPLSLTTPTATASHQASGSSSPAASGGLTSATLSGTYNAASGSQAEYRVTETLFGQSHTAVGISTAVKGSFTLSGTAVTAAGFTVPLSTVHSDQSQRDDQFDNRIMDITQYPNAAFTLTKPVDLGTIPAANTIISTTVTGNLAMHGVTRSVTFTLQAEYTASAVKVAGSIPITFANWNIQNPSGGPAQVGDTGTMQFLITLTKSA